LSDFSDLTTTTADAQAAEAADARARGATAGRAVPLTVAALLVILGLYPGPLILFQDPAWRGNAVVRQLADQRIYWVVGLVIVIGPAIVFVHLGEHNEVLRARFGDRRWYRLRLEPGDADRAPKLVPYR
jgi:hypothetical protein